MPNAGQLQRRHYIANRSFDNNRATDRTPSRLQGEPSKALQGIPNLVFKLASTLLDQGFSPSRSGGELRRVQLPINSAGVLVLAKNHHHADSLVPASAL
jgi:hypothetical protein